MNESSILNFGCHCGEELAQVRQYRFPRAGVFAGPFVPCYFIPDPPQVVPGIFIPRSFLKVRLNVRFMVRLEKVGLG